MTCRSRVAAGQRSVEAALFLKGKTWSDADCCAAIWTRTVLPHPAMLPSVKLVASSKCSPRFLPRLATYHPQGARVAGCGA
jgi:hypothetical protein